jgi:hypothetical protein
VSFAALSPDSRQILLGLAQLVVYRILAIPGAIHYRIAELNQSALSRRVPHQLDVALNVCESPYTVE